MLCHLYATDSSDSPLLRHLLTSLSDSMGRVLNILKTLLKSSYCETNPEFYPSTTWTNFLFLFPNYVSYHPCIHGNHLRFKLTTYFFIILSMIKFAKYNISEIITKTILISFCFIFHCFRRFTDYRPNHLNFVSISILIQFRFCWWKKNSHFSYTQVSDGSRISQTGRSANLRGGRVNLLSGQILLKLHTNEEIWTIGEGFKQNFTM